VRQQIYPKKKVKKERKSKPLLRGVHIDGKRWGWEFAFDSSVNCGLPRSACKHCIDMFLCEKKNIRIKIVSPDNRYFEVDAKAFYKKAKYPCGQVYIKTETKPSEVKQYIIDNLLTITEQEYAKKKIEYGRKLIPV